MKLNPHDLINLRGYGSAQKELCKANLWNDPQERIEKLIDMIDGLADDIRDAAGDINFTTSKLIDAMEAGQ